MRLKYQLSQGFPLRNKTRDLNNISVTSCSLNLAQALVQDHVFACATCGSTSEKGNGPRY